MTTITALPGGVMRGVFGSLSGTELTSIAHADHFWFAWAAFKPDTIIFQSMG